MGFLQATLNAIPAAASSPLALIAYCISIVAWVIISYRVLRNKQLLRKIESFPEEDRKAIVVIEMGAPPEGITVEAWIKSKTQTNILIGVALILLTLAFVFYMAYTNRENKPSGDITLAVDEDDSSDRYISRVDQEGVLHIDPQVNYLEKLSKNEIVQDDDLHGIGDPTLSFKISNNSKRKILISEVQIKVINMKQDLQSIFYASGWSTGTLRIKNLGWGTVEKPRVSIGITDIKQCKPKNFIADRLIKLEDDAGDYTSDINDALSDQYKSKVSQCNKMDNIKLRKMKRKYGTELLTTGSCEDIDVCVFGTISYIDNNKNKKMRFMTTVNLYQHQKLGSSGAVFFPTHVYETSLSTDDNGYTQSVPVQQSIAINDIDNFGLIIKTDQSAQMDLIVSVISSEFGVILSKKVHLHSLNFNF